MKEHFQTMFKCLAFFVNTMMATKCLPEDVNHYKIEYNDTTYKWQNLKKGASDGIDSEKGLEITAAENAGEFKIDVSESDDHHFNIRMT